MNNNVRRKCNVQLIPNNLLKRKKITKLLPVCNIIPYKDSNLGWEDKLLQYMQQLEVIVAKMEAIELINNLNSHVKNTGQYETLEETLAIANLNIVIISQVIR